MNGQELEVMNEVSHLKEAPSACELMDDFQYDPVKTLIGMDRRLSDEDAYQCKLRDDSDEANASRFNGAKKVLYRGPKYSGINHTAVLAGRIKIAESLLRYKYGRTSEVLQVEKLEVAPLVINLESDERVIEVSEGDIEDIT